MGFFIKNVLLVILLAGTHSAFGQLDFEDLTEDDVKDIMKDAAGLMTHSTASGASSLGENFGFEVGILGIYAETPDVDRLVGDGAENDYSHVPNAGLLARVGVAKFLILEMVHLPSTDFGDYNAQVTSLAAQVNLIQGEPLNLALKAFKTDGLISYSQIDEDMDLFVELDTKISGAQALVSKKFGIAEPFVGVGFVNHDGKMNARGEGTIFDIVDVTATSSVDGDGSSNHFLAGVELDLVFINLGLEASRLYENNRFSAKASMGF